MNVRCKDVLSGVFAKFCSRASKIGVIKPGSNLVKPVEVKENQRLLINPDFGVTITNSIIADAPGREVCAFVLKDDKVRKKTRPGVKVFLIREAAVLESIITPLKTLLTPPG